MGLDLRKFDWQIVVYFFKREKFVMARRWISILLVVVFIFGTCTSCSVVQSQEIVTVLNVEGVEVLYKQSPEKREASTTVEGIPIVCEYYPETEECTLRVDDETIPVHIVEHEDRLEVFLEEEYLSNYDEKVVGQMALTMTLAIPAFLFCAMILLTLTYSTSKRKKTYISLDALGRVISGIRSSVQTFKKYRVKDADAATAIRTGKLRKYNTYYPAYLSGRAVMVCVWSEISEGAAVTRLVNGLDVFSSSDYAACWAAVKAAPTSRHKASASVPHSAHDEGYYPHYHAEGRKWVNNPQFSPHAWFPPAG